MRRFLIKTSLFGAILILFFGLYLAQADGYTDPFYKRFTSDRQKNLILGNSRSAQGILPHIMDSILNNNFYNYSFTLSHSPYGPAYLKSIKRKLNKDKNSNAIFLLSIDPWSISTTGENPDDEKLFSENKRLVGTTFFVNCNPNFEYLITEFEGRYRDIYLKRNKKLFLHDNGWLEINIKFDSISYQERVQNKKKDYQEYARNFKFSNTRLKYLGETIEYLKKYGKVYLVRLPIDPIIFEIEEEYMPNFLNLTHTAIEESDGFFDLTPYNADYIYTDGNHLWKESGKKVTIKIADWIKETRME